MKTDDEEVIERREPVSWGFGYDGLPIECHMFSNSTEGSEVTDYEKLKTDVVVQIRAVGGGITKLMAADLLAALSATEAELRHSTARIAVLEKQLGEADAALIALAEGAELISDKLKIVQPFWAIYTKHGDAIEAARTRKGDHRG